MTDTQDGQSKRHPLLKDPESRALLIAALSGDARRPLSVEFLAEIAATVPTRREIERGFPELIARCDYPTYRAVVFNTLSHITENAIEGGTFAQLAYDRLGFNADDYGFLVIAGGLVICNHLDLRHVDLSDRSATARPGDD